MTKPEWFPVARAAFATLWELSVGALFLGGTSTTTTGGEMRAGTRLVVGLGNHGMFNTRHSVGMRVVDHTAAQLGLQWTTDRDCKGSIAVSATTAEHAVVLLKPRLLMNVNGKSVAATARKFGISPESVLLVHDDLDKALGKFRIKHGGSAHGHNGVRSCIASLKTNEMPRILVGIGRPVSRNDVSDYVLSPFSQAEEVQLNQTVVPSASMSILEFLQLSIKDSDET